MLVTHIYLNFDGNCEEAFTFYKSVFGGDFTMISRFRDMPEGENFNVADADKVLHVSYPIGTTLLMGSDCGSEGSAHFKQGNNFSVSLTTDNKEEAERIFHALSEKGEITMPLQDTFWGDYFGMIYDKFGIGWMVSYNERASEFA